MVPTLFIGKNVQMENNTVAISNKNGVVYINTALTFMFKDSQMKLYLNQNVDLKQSQ